MRLRASAAKLEGKVVKWAVRSTSSAHEGLKQSKQDSGATAGLNWLSWVELAGARRRFAALGLLLYILQLICWGQSA